MRPHLQQWLFKESGQVGHFKCFASRYRVTCHCLQMAKVKVCPASTAILLAFQMIRLLGSGSMKGPEPNGFLI